MFMQALVYAHTFFIFQGYTKYTIWTEKKVNLPLIKLASLGNMKIMDEPFAPILAVRPTLWIRSFKFLLGKVYAINYKEKHKEMW